MKKLISVVLICLIIPYYSIKVHAQTVHHFVSTVWSQYGPVPTQYPGYNYSNAYIWRHSITNGGQALIWIDNYTYDDGSYFDHQSSGYVSVYNSSWSYVNTDSFWNEISGYRVDNGDGTTTIYVWFNIQIPYGTPGATGTTSEMAYIEPNSVLDAGRTTSLQDQVNLIDNDMHGPVAALGINWKCLILAASDPICDEWAVIFGPESWAICVGIIYELCVHVEAIPPL